MKLPDRYSLTGEVFQGGMGEVYSAYDNHLSRKVIFKTLKDNEEERRFLDEQKALLKLRSKHVVQLYDIVTVSNDRDRKALVLEYIDGNNLTLNSILPDENYINIIWQISCGLSEIHKTGIIHRDIKPSNIKKDSSGVIKILDFGLSRNFGAEAQTISAKGTPMFMAPELWKRTSVSFDEAIDTYAFGVTALCLVKGGGAPPEMLTFPPTKIPPGTLAKYLAGAPSPIASLIEACLNFDPLKRPTMQYVEQTLRKHLLYNKHRALLVADQKIYELHSGSTSANIAIAPLGTINIQYNGSQFLIANHDGFISINNRPATIGDELPACCVITFGAGKSRKFITFDTSHPEVMP